MSPNREAIERGLQFESTVADALGGKKQPGSGNKFFAPSDVLVPGGILVSCKSEIDLTIKKLKRHLDEAIDLAQGTGNIPALAFEYNPITDGDELVLMRLSDFAKALQEVTIPKKFESRGVEKRENAEIPIMLR